MKVLRTCHVIFARHLDDTSAAGAILIPSFISKIWACSLNLASFSPIARNYLKWNDDIQAMWFFLPVLPSFPKTDFRAQRGCLSTSLLMVPLEGATACDSNKPENSVQTASNSLPSDWKFYLNYWPLICNSLSMIFQVYAAWNFRLFCKATIKDEIFPGKLMAMRWHTV